MTADRRARSFLEQRNETTLDSRTSRGLTPAQLESNELEKNSVADSQIMQLIALASTAER